MKKRKTVSLGKSNDRGVGDEIRAARWFASVIDEWRTTGPARHLPRGARPGWDAHAGDKDSTWYRDGWLLREMYIVRADLSEAPWQPDSWPWDPSRPIAGQFEEWVKRTDANIAAMEDDAAEQFVELVGPTDQGQPRAETREEYNQRTGTTRHTVPGEPFAPEDSATKEPWLDPGASTRLTDAELVETVAYCPPGSVRG